MTTSPVLVFPDFTKEFLLDTDAIDQGIGAVLSQIQSDGQERVIAYASRLLTKSERHYCITHKELLAVVTFYIIFDNTYWRESLFYELITALCCGCIILKNQKANLPDGWRN